MILLDTCVISETLRPEPSPGVISWLDSVPEYQMYVPVLVVGELQKGIDFLARGKKRTALKLWFEQLLARFHYRIPVFDQESAIRWGKLTAELEHSGKSIPLIDGMLAALALRHSALLATRNTVHYKDTGVEILDPWA